MLTFLFYGCASKPQDMIDKTEHAMQDAKAAHADFFAPDDWKAAEQASGQAQTLLEQKKWGEANTALLKALNRYGKARELAQGKKEAFVKEVQGYQTVTEKRLKELKDKIAAGAKLSAASKKTLDEECKTVEENNAKVTTQIGQGQFSDAKLLAQQTMRKVWEVQEEYFPSKGAKK